MIAAKSFNKYDQSTPRVFSARIAPNDRKVQPYVHYVTGGTFNGEAISKK